jgi:hypothetical protein
MTLTGFDWLLAFERLYCSTMLLGSLVLYHSSECPCLGPAPSEPEYHAQLEALRTMFPMRQ